MSQSRPETRFIFITGGVVSALGKGIAAASLGRLLVARGLSNKDVAALLFISPKTVANHVDHIYAKIDASNRAAASLFAMQHGLLPDERFPARVAA